MSEFRRPNEFLQERLVVTFDHAALTAGLGAKIAQPSQMVRVKGAKYINPTGLAADNTNNFAVDLRRCGAADALVFADATFTTTHGTETVNITGHGLQTGDGPFRMTNAGGALPAGYAAATDYYAIRTGANTLQLAASRALAFAGTAVAITDDGTGTHTLSDTASTRRPVVVASGVNTDGDGGGVTLAADTFVALTLSATDANLVLAAGDDLLFVATEGGTATLPAGRMVVELATLN